MKNKIKLILCLFLCLYMFAYILFSVLGSYSEKPIISGKNSIDGYPMGIYDEFIWEPKWVIFRPYKKNVIGYAYFPLLWFDRSLWHKSINIVNMSEQEKRKLAESFIRRTPGLSDKDKKLIMDILGKSDKDKREVFASFVKENPDMTEQKKQWLLSNLGLMPIAQEPLQSQ